MATSNGIPRDNLRLDMYKWTVFALDLIHCVAPKYATFWLPLGKVYTSRPLTLMNATIQNAASIITEHRYEDFRGKFLELVRNSRNRDGTRCFLDHAKYTLLLTRHYRKYAIGGLFEMMVYIAGLSILFCQTGCYQTPSLAATLIADAMFNHTKGRLGSELRELHSIALLVIRYHKLFHKAKA